MTTLKVSPQFQCFIGIGEVVIVDALHEVSSSHFIKELGDEGLSSGGTKLNSIFITAEKKTKEGMADSQPREEEFRSEHDQQANMKATPRKLAYVDSDKEAPTGKSQRTPSKNKEPTHLRRSRRLEDRSITKEKARMEKSKPKGKRSVHQETSSDSEREEGSEDALRFNFRILAFSWSIFSSCELEVDSEENNLQNTHLSPKHTSESKNVASKSKTGQSNQENQHGSALDNNLSQPSASTPVVDEIHKEEQQAAGGPPSLGVTSEEGVGPQLI
ncbi:hypothetical protein Tco_1517613 [Tanacetum coccineum]